jgi:pimeloyl-ACP methyl ester carboxylesterase
MRLLPDDKFTAYAIDLRGSGDSGKPEAGNNFSQFVDDVSQFLDAKHLLNAVMIGHSMGGSLLQDFVFAHPQ